MVLKACPFPGFVFHPENLEENSWVEGPNIKMSTLIDSGSLEALKKTLLASLPYNHPAIFPFSQGSDAYFAVIMPLIEGPDDNGRLCLMVANPAKTTFEPPLLKEDSWHELNNPLAIISLTLQRSFKKETLNQEDIDTLLERINSTFIRIESYILGQIQLGQL